MPSLLSGQEMPQHRDPERTPPSEEDSAEAERLKTEGRTCALPPRRDPGPRGRRRPSPLCGPRWVLSHLSQRAGLLGGGGLP